MNGEGGGASASARARGDASWGSAPLRLLAARFFSTHHACADDALIGAERPRTAPAYALLVGRARRFTSLVTQLHLEVCAELHAAAPHPPLAVFATCHGEIQTAEVLIADLRDHAQVSSARFALSVHNTPSGLYSVATQSSAPTTTLTGGNALAAGWLEAALLCVEQGQPVLLSVADEPVPSVFEGPAEPAGVAAAFLLAPAGAEEGAPVRLASRPAAPDGGDAGEASMLHTLAAVVEAWTHRRSTTLELGRIAPGAILELRLRAEGGHP